MKKSKYNEEQIIGVLKRMEAGQKARELARKLDDRSLNNYTMKCFIHLVRREGHAPLKHNRR